MTENSQNLTLSVATSIGPLFWPTRKNSTVTVFFSVRLEALDRCVNRGKALARAHAEAKTSERSHTIWNSSQQQNSSHTTRVWKDTLKRICYLRYYWGRGEKRRWVANNRALSQDKLIHHVLHGLRGSVKVPQWTGPVHFLHGKELHCWN